MTQTYPVRPKPVPKPSKKLKGVAFLQAYNQSPGQEQGAKFMATTNGSTTAVADAVAASNKPKRVRTGCLTCRERHLKCDEASPNCMNCRKSSRVCRRGVRLNFIDTQCRSPPVIPPTEDWSVAFLDESREVASEYKGGLDRYASRSSEPVQQPDTDMQFEYSNEVPTAPAMAHQPLPSIQGMLPVTKAEDHQNINTFSASHDQHHANMFAHQVQLQHPTAYEQTKDTLMSNTFEQKEPHLAHGLPSMDSTYTGTTVHSQPSHYEHVHHPATPPDEPSEAREILSSQEEVFFMQVFVEEVGIWMDSMDSLKHFSRLLPFHALGHPMLLNAFLACGVRHLTLVNPAVYKEEKALSYYDIASRYLLRALQNAERDSVICATTAVILNVYEIMTEKALPRMNHIAGARALIKECGWNAASHGIGAACFWLNVGLELMSNLRFNWQASWHPDAWGLDLDFTQETESGREEVWTHRVVYITAKISDFRATIPRVQDASPHTEHMRRQKRLEEWSHLKDMAEAWNNSIPRTMHPMAYLYPYQTNSNSTFPEVWLIKRATIVARLFYHTAMLVLAQVNPVMSKEMPEMHEMEQQHAHQICGIVAHVKDRGVASAALRCLAIAAECLSIRREQEEVLLLFAKIHQQTGWRLGFIPEDLRERWGWDPTAPSPLLPTHQEPQRHMSRLSVSSSTGTQAQQYSPYQFDQYGEMQRFLQQQQEQQAQAQAQAQAEAAAAAQAHAQQQTTPPRRIPPQGIVNPMFAGADFGMAKHPYQDVYVPPNHAHQQQHGLGQGLGLGMYSSQGVYQY